MQEINNTEWAMIAIGAVMVVVAVSLLMDYISKRKTKVAVGSKRAMATFEPKQGFEALHDSIIRRLQFIEEEAKYNDLLGEEYQRLSEETIYLRNMIRKERAMFSLWRDGDPHPYRDLIRWKGVRNRRIEEYKSRGIISEDQFATDGTLLNFYDRRRIKGAV